MRSRRAIPPRLLEPPPEVNPGLELYMAAFWDLCCDRYREGYRIPWMAVQAWCDAHQIEYDEQADVHTLVRKLDIAYLQWMQKKSKKPAKQSEALKGDTRGVREAH